MKRYIRYVQASKTEKVDIDTSLFKGTPFQCYTGMSYYDDFLNHKDLSYMQKEKNRTGEIVMMTPEEYYEACAKHGFGHETTVANLKDQRGFNRSKIEKFKKMMQSGTKFCLCVINYADNSQEGLHRMMAAGELYGWDKKFPVLAVTAYDNQEEDARKLRREVDTFLRYDFKKICEYAVDTLADYRIAPPDDFADQLHGAIVTEAKDFEEGYDIDVLVEQEEVDGEPRVCVSLTRYFDYEIPNPWCSYEVWLANIFNLTGDPIPESKGWELPDDIIDELAWEEINNMELDDKSIADFFFKHKSN